MVSRTMSGVMWVEKARILAFFVLALLVVALVGVFWATPAHAKTFMVNSTADTEDASPDGTCDSCTLREAIQEANNAATSPGADTINFAIPGVGPHRISSTSALPTITEAVTIDGYTQGDSTPGDPSDDATENTLKIGNDAVLKIELRGPGAQSGVTGLKIEAANSTVKGLVINGWDNAVFLSTGATGNKVQGNYIGTDVAGDTKVANNIGVVAPSLDNTDNTIGGTTVDARNIISGNGSGVQIESALGGNKVQGNYIGTDASGTQALGNTTGVVIRSSPGSIIGGTTAAARNIISGNSAFGVAIGFTDATDNKVMGNYIGTDATGMVTDPDGIPNNGDELGNSDDGVAIQANADDNIIGGTTAGAGNLISGNGGDGVEVNFTFGSDSDPATGNSILSNSIYANDELGIDLVHSNNLNEEVSCNDPDDNDVGPNSLQNYPVITSAKLTTKRIGGHRRKVTIIKGTLNSEADKIYNIQFFGSPEADPPSGPPPCGPASFGEGKTFLGQKSVTTNGSGDASFTFTSRKKVPKGQVVTATATNNTTGDTSEGDTSEFSQAVTVT